MHICLQWNRNVFRSGYPNFIRGPERMSFHAVDYHVGIARDYSAKQQQGRKDGVRRSE